MIVKVKAPTAPDDLAVGIDQANERVPLANAIYAGTVGFVSLLELTGTIDLVTLGDRGTIGVSTLLGRTLECRLWVIKYCRSTM